MRKTNVLAILVLVLVLVACSAKISKAVPFGTAFTYEGFLIEDRGRKPKPANGQYDFEFSLFDVNDIDVINPVSITITEEDVEVVNGNFTTTLNFGIGIFAGEARWLEIAVRDGDSIDPDDFSPLGSRMELTPMPYAINASSAEDANTLDGLDSIDFALFGHVHDNRYYTRTELQTSGSAIVNWSNLSNVPAGFADGTDDVGRIPTGVIVMWSGSIASIPTGWALCDGTNSTPDLTSRFIRSVPNASTNPGSTGGSSTHTHSAGKYSASAHKHTYSGTTNSFSANMRREGDQWDSKMTGTHSHTYSGTTGSVSGGSITGTSAEASVLPSYYEMAYIIKL